MSENLVQNDAEKRDAEENKLIGVLAYIIFFLPLIAARESKFAMYHANQGLIVFLLGLAVNIVGSVIPFLGWFIIWPLGNLIILVLAILGIVNAAQGQKKELPLVGKIQIIK